MLKYRKNPVTIINPLKKKEIEEMKFNSENFKKIYNTCTSSFKNIPTINFYASMNTSKNNFTNTRSGYIRNRTLPSIYKGGFRKNKNEIEIRKRKDCYNPMSTNDYYSNTLYDVSSYSGNEVNTTREDYNQKNDFKQLNQKENSLSRIKIDIQNKRFLNKLEEKANKFKNLCMKELNKKSEIYLRQRKKFNEEIEYANKKVCYNVIF